MIEFDIGGLRARLMTKGSCMKCPQRLMTSWANRRTVFTGSFRPTSTELRTPVFHIGFLVRKRKESIMRSTLLLGGRRGSGGMLPQFLTLYFLRFLLVASEAPKGL